MSKKDKSKFRKQIKAQLMQDMAKFQSSQEEHISQKPAINQPGPHRIAAKQSQPVAVLENSEINLPQIKYDLKKTGIIVGGVAIIIAALYFLNLKYDILLSSGDIIFRTLHIR